MNENKISFIICCNDDFYIEECYCYLDELAIPEGYEADIIEIRACGTRAGSSTWRCRPATRGSCPDAAATTRASPT